MAKIEQVAYGKTFNIGNYESVRLDVTVRVEPGETPEQALDTARDWVTAEYQYLRTGKRPEPEYREQPPDVRPMFKPATDDVLDLPF
ncbi:MAG: hypothetical protein M3R24_28030 [Chloroflexota bacterium]|nr:hypothetical protein [Chloroflexota bacterium]